MRLDEIERVELGFYPTPLHELPRLARELSLKRLLVKRDDLTGLAFGGNKVRKLEYLLADALAKGCAHVVTCGGVQSNHCRQTAAACARLGLKCTVVLQGRPPGRATGNLLLDGLLGAEARFVEAEDWAALEARSREIAREIEGRGEKPYYMPVGGSVPRGALGYVRAVGETAAQLEETAGRADATFFASSSGGTQAGLEVGRKLFGWETELIGIGVAKTGSGLAEDVARLACGACELLGMEEAFDPEHVNIDHAYMGEKYGSRTEAAREAIDLAARTEGLLLDRVYAGKAMAGLVDYARKGKLEGKAVLFIHTGGQPELFA